MEHVAVRLVVQEPFLHALDPHVAEDRQIGEVGAEHLLDLQIDRAAPGTVDLAHAVLQQPVHLRVLVLRDVAPRARLGRDVLGVDPVQAVGVVADGGLDADHERVELGLHVELTPDDGGRHVADLHVHADRPPVLLQERLRLLAELVPRRRGVGEAEAHAPLGADAVRPGPPPRLVEDLLRLLGVVLVLRQIRVVRPGRRGQVALDRLRHAVVDLLDDGALVRRVVERLAHRPFLEPGFAVVEVDVLDRGRVVEVERDAGQAFRLRVELRRDSLEPRHVDRARLELRVEHREVGDVLEDDALQVRRPAVVVGVRDEHEVVARDAAPELEGPGADRAPRVELRGVRVGNALEEVRGDDPGVAPRREERRERLLEPHADRRLVRCLHGRDRVEADLGEGAELRVRHQLPGELHVTRGEGLAVVPRDALLQPEGVLEPVLRDPTVLDRRDLDREVRDELGALVRAPEAVEDAEVDAAVHLDVGPERVEHGRLLREPDHHLPAPPGHLGRAGRARSDQRSQGRDRPGPGEHSQRFATRESCHDAFSRARVHCRRRACARWRDSRP